MSYDSWKKDVVAHLVADGLDESSVRKAFDEAEMAIKAQYASEDRNAAGAEFVLALTRYDLDLEIARQRGKGRLKDDLATEYGLSPDETKARWTLGAVKKIRILGWFRGEEVNVGGSFDG